MMPAEDRSLENAIAARIRDRTAVVAVLGLGYVGLPLVDALLAEGFAVLGIDTDARRIERLRAGETVAGHLGDDLFRRLAKSDRFELSTHAEALARADIVVVSVPTPLTEAGMRPRTPDLSHVLDAGAAIGRHGPPGQLIILESTVAPGTTRGAFRGAINAAAGRPNATGPTRFIAHAPEREDPGRAEPARRSIPRLVGGLDGPSTRLAEAFYAAVCDAVVPVDSAEIAEAAKLLENTYRAVNIALVNEMKTLLEPMDIDIWAVVRAASTKPFGFQAFSPGPGTGGHCIPVDPVYLSHLAAERGIRTPLIDSAVVVNRAMPAFVVDRTVQALAARSRPVSGARILVVGLAYKPDLDDTRESPAFDLIARFEGLGALVSYHDPHIPSMPHTPHMPDMPDQPHPITRRSSVPLDEESIRAFDALVIATAHSAIDWEPVARHATLVIDTRGVMRQYALAMTGRLVHA